MFYSGLFGKKRNDRRRECVEDGVGNFNKLSEKALEAAENFLNSGAGTESGYLYYAALN